MHTYVCTHIMYNVECVYIYQKRYTIDFLIKFLALIAVD